jgi:AbrB family looped-hinge helix DNA binding protein
MTKVRINYDGWLALPAAVRERLGLSTGDELELADEGVLLRPLRAGAAAASAPASVGAVESATTTAREPLPAVKRSPGRPRKAGLPIIPPTLKARGGRRRAATVEGSAP